jgi:hypothetical protein
MRKGNNPRTYLVPRRASNWSKGRMRLRTRAIIPPMEKLVDMTMMRESLNPAQIQQHKTLNGKVSSCDFLHRSGDRRILIAGHLDSRKIPNNLENVCGETCELKSLTKAVASYDRLKPERQIITYSNPTHCTLF